MGLEVTFEVIPIDNDLKVYSLQSDLTLIFMTT